MRTLASRPVVAMVAAAGLVAVTGLGLVACSSGSSDSRAAAGSSAEPAPAGSGMPTDGSNVTPDVVNLDIMQADNGKTLTMTVGQLADFPDMPEGDFEVVSSDEEVVQGVGLETLQIGAVKEGKADIVIQYLDSGEPVLQFSVEVIPAK